MIKNKIFTLLLTFLMVLTPIFIVGCSNDEILGNWKVSSYMYIFDGQEKYVSKEEAKNITYIDIEDSVDNEQSYLNNIKVFNETSELITIKICKHNVFKIVTDDFQGENEDIYKWSKKDNNIEVVDKTTKQTIYNLSPRENNLIMDISNGNGITIYIVLEKQ